MTHPPKSRRCLAVVCGVLALASFAPARTVTGQRYAYTLNVPDDWLDVPDDVVQKTQAFLEKTPNKGGRMWDRAFQPARPKRDWMNYPYVIVQVLPYAGLGVTGQLHEDDFPSFIRGLTGTDIEKAAKNNMSDQASGLVKTMAAGVPVLDAPGRKFTMGISTQVAGVGAIEGRMVGHFGHDAMILVCYYDRPASWPAFDPVARVAADSLTFTAGHEFNDQESDRYHARTLGRRFGETVGRAIIPAGVVGGVIAIVFVLKKRNGGAGGPPPQPRR